MAGHRGLDVMGHRCPGQPFAGGSAPLPIATNLPQPPIPTKGRGLSKETVSQSPGVPFGVAVPKVAGRTRDCWEKIEVRNFAACSHVCRRATNAMLGKLPQLALGTPVPDTKQVGKCIDASQLRVLVRLATPTKTKGFRRRGPGCGPGLLQ